MNRALVSVALTAVAAACASGGSRRVCEPVPAEFVGLLSSPIYPECAVERRGRSLTPIEPSYTPARNASCVKSGIALVIDSTGRPLMSSAKITQTTDSAHAFAVLAQLARARFSPARHEGRQVAVFTEILVSMEKAPFVLPGTRPPASAGPRC